jgi:hypothetical protein
MNFCQRVQFSAPSFFREGKILKDINLNEIEMNGKKYPFYCDLNVLELIQDNFKSVNQFERDILGLSPIRDEDGEVKRNDKGEILHEQIEPRIKAVAFGVFVMIREGQRIRERETGEKSPEITMEDIREGCRTSFIDLSVKVAEEFNKCFEVKKKENPKESRKSIAK